VVAVFCLSLFVPGILPVLSAAPVPTAEKPVSVGVELTSLELTSLSEKRSEARAVLKVSNPLASPARMTESHFVLRIHEQEVGQGVSPARTVRPHKVKGIEIPIRIDRKSFLAAMEGNFNAGMQIDAELSGPLVLRLSTGEVTMPLRLSGQMGTDGARSGVFAIPEGGGSLSPH